MRSLLYNSYDIIKKKKELPIHLKRVETKCKIEGVYNGYQYEMSDNWPLFYKRASPECLEKRKNRIKLSIKNQQLIKH